MTAWALQGHGHVRRRAVPGQAAATRQRFRAAALEQASQVVNERLRAVKAVVEVPSDTDELGSKPDTMFSCACAKQVESSQRTVSRLLPGEIRAGVHHDGGARTLKRLGNGQPMVFPCRRCW